MSNKLSLETLNQIGEGHFPGLMGIEITEIGNSSLSGQMTLRPEFMAPNGYLHAGSLVTFADTLAGYATRSFLPEGAKSFTTIELKTNFLRTLKEGVIEGHTEAEHMGRTTHVWRIKVLDKASQKVLCIFSCTQMILY